MARTAACVHISTITARELELKWCRVKAQQFAHSGRAGVRAGSMGSISPRRERRKSLLGSYCCQSREMRAGYGTTVTCFPE
jgi:hypothetical protein